MFSCGKKWLDLEIDKLILNSSGSRDPKEPKQSGRRTKSQDTHFLISKVTTKL